MDLVLLSRIQFAWTVGFHYLFPPLNIGLSILLVLMEGTYLRTRNPLYHRLARFWTRIFGLTFALGVASGIVMEFQFGTNWSQYSRYVGDVFGSALAAEGIFAFFLESGFLGLLLFGWDRIKPGLHFLATVMVALGAHFSAIWIVVANSWQQTPAGYVIDTSGPVPRAVTENFWQVVFNPSFLERISHVYLAAWLAGAFFVLSVSAYYMLRGRCLDFARAGMRIGLIVAAVASVFQLASGHSSAVGIAGYQPAKFAATEAHYAAKEPADAYIFGWVDEENRKVYGLRIPRLLSILLHRDPNAPVVGLEAFPRGDWPPVNITFLAYHLMVIIGFTLIGIMVLGALFLWRGTLERRRWFLWILVVSVVLPEMANQFGWAVAEVGRQPWIVYGLMRTADAVSRSIGAGSVLSSLVLFTLIYILLFLLFIYLLNAKIQQGPPEPTASEEPGRGKLEPGPITEEDLYEGGRA